MAAPEKATEIKAAITAVLAFFTALWGWLGWAILIWIFCFLLDYLSGTAAARKAGEWSSSIAREGVWHKLGEIFAVLVAALCDIALKIVVSSGLDLGIELPTLVTPIVLLWYIITELGSITENAEKMGAPVPHWIKKGLKQYRDKIDRDHEVPEAVTEAPAVEEHVQILDFDDQDEEEDDQETT